MMILFFHLNAPRSETYRFCDRVNGYSDRNTDGDELIRSRGYTIACPALFCIFSRFPYEEPWHCFRICVDSTMPISL